MPKFKIKKKNSNIIIETKVKGSDQLSSAEAEFVSANFVHGFFKTQVLKGNKVEFTAPEGVSLYEYLSKPIDRHGFFLLCMQIAAAARKISEAGLSVKKLVLDVRYIYINIPTGTLWFMYLPVAVPDTDWDVITLIRGVCYLACTNTKSYPEYVYRFDNFLASQSVFDYKRVEDFIRNEDNAAVVEIEKKNKANGTSGFMTNKRKDYYEHYDNAQPGYDAQGTPAGGYDQYAAPPAGGYDAQGAVQYTPYTPQPEQTQYTQYNPQGAPAGGFDPYTGAPVSGYASQPAPIAYDTNTGAPIYGYDPYTGAPIYDAYQNAGYAEPSQSAPEYNSYAPFADAAADEEKTGLLDENNAGYTPENAQPSYNQYSPEAQMQYTPQAEETAYNPSFTPQEPSYNQYSQPQEQYNPYEQPPVQEAPYVQPQMQNAQGGFDPYTGQPIGAQPQNNFDPYTGQPIGAQPQNNFDPYTGQPIGAQPQNNFDPYTGQPLGAQPQNNFDPYTGQPLGQGAPQYTPYTPQPEQPQYTPYTPQPEQPYTQPAQEYPDDYGSEETTLLVDETEETTLLVDDEPAYRYPVLTRVSTGESVSVDKPVFRVGKEKSYVDFFVSNNSAVSRSHADIICRGGVYYIKDLNSKNRTFINERAILPNEEVEIHYGDSIRLANEDFIFQERA